MEQKHNQHQQKINKAHAKLKEKLALSIATAVTGVSLFGAGVALFFNDIFSVGQLYLSGFSGMFLMGAGAGATIFALEGNKQKKSSELSITEEEFKKFTEDHEYIEQNFGK